MTSSPVGHHSLPRTPPVMNSEVTTFSPIRPKIWPKSFSVGGCGSLNESRWSASLNNYSGASSNNNNSSVLTMREYDETIKDLRKENFNLKLRIYFLEERLGTSSRLNATGAAKEELIQSNIDLKVQVESIKHENKEKTELLAEASQAIESLESRLSMMALEREDERSQLELKLHQLDEDLEDRNQLAYGAGQLINSNQPNDSDDDSDELIDEVEAEMARGVYVAPKISSSQQTTPVPQQKSLEVVEEKDEAMAGKLEDLEDNVERLNAIIHDTELCLQHAQEEVESRMEHIQDLEVKLAQCNKDIEDLKHEKHAKIEEAAKARHVSYQVLHLNSNFDLQEKILLKMVL